MLFSYEHSFVPGLLQIEEYASTLMRHGQPLTDIGDKLKDRLNRQDILRGEDAPTCVFIMDERVLRNRVESPEVMREQMQKLIDAATLANVIIQVFPEKSVFKDPASVGGSGSSGAGRRVVRSVYEIATFQALRDQLRCKEIWVVGADRYRNPDEDLPADFESRRPEHYAALRKPLDPTAFIDQIRAEMRTELFALDEAMPGLDWFSWRDPGSRLFLGVACDTPSTQCRLSEKAAMSGCSSGRGTSIRQPAGRLRPSTQQLCPMASASGDDEVT